MVFHPGDMSCPAKLCFEEHGLDASNLSHCKDLNVGDEITPIDVQDSTLMVTLDGVQMPPIGDPYDSPCRRVVSTTAL